MARAVPTSFCASGNRDSIFLSGAANQRLTILQDRFLDSLPVAPASRERDLLRIAAAVYAIDRVAKRSYRDDEFGSRWIEARLEVRDPDFWRSSPIGRQISSILNFLTGDLWEFRFEPISNSYEGDERLLPLALRDRTPPDRIALYSGGLDSAAGLANRLIHTSCRYATLTVGHQAALRKRCRIQIRELQQLLGCKSLVVFPMVVRLRGGAARRLSLQEQTQRSRAFLFFVTAAVMAKAHGLRDVDVFENGIGAINLPLTIGMMFGGMATRGTHPTFVDEMSNFCSIALDSDIKFHLPFVRMTKGEVLKTLGHRCLEDWLRQSRSCVHTSPRNKSARQCGVCPACIERRQAFAVAGIDDREDYMRDVLSDPPVRGFDAAYLRLYRYQALSWLEGRSSATTGMEWHMRSTQVAPALQGDVTDLWSRHAQEVVSVFGGPRVDPQPVLEAA